MARTWGITVLAIALIALGLVSQWAMFVGIGVGLITLVLLATIVMRPPRQAQWWPIHVPTITQRRDPETVMLGIEVGGSPTWVSARDDHGQMMWVTAGEWLTWPVDTERRGEWRIGPEQLVFADPFGFAQSVLAQRELTNLLVTPRISPAPLWRDTRSSDGESLVDISGADAFHSLREYAVGDPLNRIHWKSSAKTGTLMVRHMVQTANPTLLVILDTHPHSYSVPHQMNHEFDANTFEEAVDLWASWVVANSTSGEVVRATTTTPGAPVLPVGNQGMGSALRWMAFITAEDENGSASNTAARVAALSGRTPGQRVVLVTGKPAGGAISRHRNIMVVQAR